MGTHAHGPSMAGARLVDGGSLLAKAEPYSDMIIDLPISNGIRLQMASGNTSVSSFPTARIQKGLILWCDGQDLSEEAVGFGVPILKQGLHTIFPGEVELYRNQDSPPNEFNARFKLNLEEKFIGSGSTTIHNQLIYRVKNIFAGMIRNYSWSRNFLTAASNLLRSTLHWQTTYEPADFSTYLALRYCLNAGKSSVVVELIERGFTAENITEIIIMNEQGAHFFDQFHADGGMIKRGDEIGIWDEVITESAAFICSSRQVSFCLPQVIGARLFHGRELIGRRLAWAGFGYTFSPSLRHFAYEININR